MYWTLEYMTWHSKDIIFLTIQMYNIYFGLTKKNVMNLACERTVKYDLSRPQTWDDSQVADEK